MQLFSRLPIDLSFALGLSLCGLSPDDWCQAPKWDSCGQHKSAADCREDRNCVGLRYRGESVEACMFDSRGFAMNCPTVGCVTPCEKLSGTQCNEVRDRCKLDAGHCEELYANRSR